MYLKPKKAFTLIELLIYVVIFAIAAGLLSGITLTITRTHSRESASNEVTSQISFIQSTIQRLVREASLIENEPGEASSTLTLRMEDTLKDPTIISADSNAIYLKQGVEESSSLTSNRVKVDEFEVTKYENPGGHATVQLFITLTYNSENIYQQVSRTLRTAIARVTAATFDSDLLPNKDNAFNVGGDNRWKNAYFSGNVGIGTTAPGAMLDIYKVDPNDPGLRISNNNHYWDIKMMGSLSGIQDTELQFAVNGSANPVLTIQRNGNVGIGTTGPSEDLHIDSASDQDDKGLRIGKTSYWNILNKGTWAGDYDAALTFQYQGGDKVTFLRSGNVGIGTAEPTARLHIFGANNADNLIIDSAAMGGLGDYSNLAFELSAQTVATIGIASETGWPHSLTFSTAATADSETEKMRITSAGNIGIGTTEPGTYINSGAYFKPDASGRNVDIYSANNEAVLNLVSNQNTSDAHIGGLYFTRSAGQADAHYQIAAIQARQVGTGTLAGGDLYFFAKPTDGGIGVDTPGMVIKSNGDIGIGTTSPASGYRLDVEGKIQATAFDVGDITFRDQKTQKILWRMFEDEDGLYLENKRTGKVYKFVLQEIEK